MEVFPATVLNFITLIIVSLWRVFLMFRVLVEIFQIKRSFAFGVILIPACLEMCVATFFKQIDIIGIMGGMRLSPSDEFLLLATSIVFKTSGILFLLSILGVIILSRRYTLPRVRFDNLVNVSPSRGIWISTLSALLIWLSVASYFQPLLKNKQHLLSLMGLGNLDAVTQFLSNKEPEDFPAGHHIFEYQYGDNIFHLLDLLMLAESLPS